MAFFGGGGGPKSRSLDDIAAAAGEASETTKNKKPCLKDAGRANTYEDREEFDIFLSFAWVSHWKLAWANRGIFNVKGSVLV